MTGYFLTTSATNFWHIDFVSSLPAGRLFFIQLTCLFLLWVFQSPVSIRPPNRFPAFRPGRCNLWPTSRFFLLSFPEHLQNFAARNRWWILFSPNFQWRP